MRSTSLTIAAIILAGIASEASTVRPWVEAWISTDGVGPLPPPGGGGEEGKSSPHASSPAPGSRAEPASGAPAGSPLDGLDQLREGRSYRASSADDDWRNGNRDARPIAPGETLTVAELTGPGRITHIWFTIAADDPHYGRSVTVRMYWDGREEPSVEAPLGDFFAAGHGITTTVNSLPVQVSSEGRAYNCYWPMPFRKSARITVSNESPTYRVNALFWYVDWVKLPGLPPRTAYFHAQYRQEFPCTAGQDYLILDAEGSGHYVGTVLSVHMNGASWFGEGDDRFYIDGEPEPSLRGTGTEDYFCDAWGFRQFNNHFYGVSIWQGFDIDDHGTAYRWHIPDPIPFAKSLTVTIEHKGVTFIPLEVSSDEPLKVTLFSGQDAEAEMRRKRKTKEGSYEYVYYFESDSVKSGFEGRPDNFSSVAFWYQTGRAKRFATLPPAPQRLVLGTTLEAESLVDEVRGTPAEGLEVQKGGEWFGGAQLFYHPPPGEDPPVLAVPFEIEDRGRYVLKASVTASWDYGVFRIDLDGKPVVGEVDLYAPEVAVRQQKLGVRTLDPGTHTLTFTYVRSNPRSVVKGTDQPGRYLGLDRLYVRKLPARFVAVRKKSEKAAQ